MAATRPTPAQADLMRRLDATPHAYSTWGTMSRLSTNGWIRPLEANSHRYGHQLTEEGRAALAAYDAPKRIGRPAKGKRAMTPAEKQAAYRERNQADKPLTLSEARQLLGQLHFFTRVAVNAGALPDEVAGNTPRETANQLATWIAKQGFVKEYNEATERICNL